VRILLDEQITPDVAVALRARGHDVVAAQEDADLRSLPDPELLAIAQMHRRAIVTENIDDFRDCADATYAAGGTHFGLLYTSNRSLPRHRNDAFIRELVRRLDRYLKTHPADDPSSIEAFL
jgi:predicted nuclease of predicted toxin-antitoxin system